MKTKQTAESMTWDEADALWAGLALPEDRITPDEADELASAFVEGKRAGHADGFRKGFAAALASANDAAS